MPQGFTLDGSNKAGLSMVVVCDRCGSQLGPVITQANARSIAWAHFYYFHATTRPLPSNRKKNDGHHINSGTSDRDKRTSHGMADERASATNRQPGATTQPPGVSSDDDATHLPVAA
jgi:hypothetical protein